MKLRYFGDSFDVVKQAMIGWLSVFGEWVVHPMFTEAEVEVRISEFTRFLGAALLSADVLSDSVERGSYLACCEGAGNLLLDPDTGLRLRALSSAQSVAYLFASELIRLARLRPAALTLVFDKSVSRGDERRQTKRKLAHFASEGLYAFAYVSHACFLLVSQDEELAHRAHRRIRQASRLPEDRFCLGWPAA